MLGLGLFITRPQKVEGGTPPTEPDIRITEDGDTRITEDGDTRVTEESE